MWRVIDLGGSGYFLHMKHNSLLVEKDEQVLLGTLFYSNIGAFS